MKKIDIHCHTTNRALRHTFTESATIQDIAAYACQFEIEKIVLLATYFPRVGTGITNFRLKDWIDSFDPSMFLMFGSLDFESYFRQGMNELEELFNYIKGVKIYSGYQNIDFFSEKFRTVLSFCKNHELPIMFHTGWCESYQAGSTETDPIFSVKELQPMVVQNPSVNFILSHMGSPELDEIIEMVGDNVYTDVSGLINSRTDQHEWDAQISYIKEFYDRCGADNLMFGSDFPVQSHSDSIKFIEEVVSIEDQPKVFYFNAAKLLGVEK